MMFDCMVEVKCEAIYSITKLLTSFTEIPRHETGLFMDYLFPRLVRLLLRKKLALFTIVQTVYRIILNRNKIKLSVFKTTICISLLKFPKFLWDLFTLCMHSFLSYTFQFGIFHRFYMISFK